MKLPAHHTSTHLQTTGRAIHLQNPHIGFILDGSGSMSSMKDEAIYSFNLLLRHQVTHRRKATFNLTTFAKTVSVGPLVDIKQCQGLSDRDYHPAGETPLYDAIGETAEQIDSVLNYPKQVVIVIITDGFENASRRWKRAEDIRLLIEEKLSIGWQFLYCSCSHNPYEDARQIGISRDYVTDFMNLPEVFRKVSNLLTDFRSGVIKQITFERRR